MAFDEGLAERLRDIFRDRHDVVEKRMFGGLAFMLRGHMCVGILRDTLMTRVGPDQHDEALREPHVRPMDFTGRPMRGFLIVDPAGFESDARLARWVGRCVAFVTTLPPK